MITISESVADIHKMYNKMVVTQKEQHKQMAQRELQLEARTSELSKKMTGSSMAPTRHT